MIYHRDYIHVVRRSIQMINNRTQVIGYCTDGEASNHFIVRRLVERILKDRQLFIVTLTDETEEGYVIPFAEIGTSSTDKLRLIVKPEEQYPSLDNTFMMNKIESIISHWMANKFGRSAH